jgi:hypothetical protein
MFRPAVVGHESMKDPRCTFLAVAADLVGVVLLVMGVIMIVSLILLPLGIVSAYIGTLSLMRGLNDTKEHPRSEATSQAPLAR